MLAMRGVVVLGSTGSVGSQTLEVIAAHPQRLRVVGLAAGGGEVDLLARQAILHRAAVVAVGRSEVAENLRRALAFHLERDRSTGRRPPTVIAGPSAAAQLAAGDLPVPVDESVDVVLNGITGSVGLTATLAGLESGRTVALANKESLVAGGPLVRAALDATPSSGALGWLRSYPGSSRPKLVPVDSEHTALLQCLRAGRRDELRRLILTASGGPFRGSSAEQLRSVTRDQAMSHPTWQMGPVITVNSAT
ncbi:MAG: hypothetical protein ACRDQZ_23255, partial [Mycobacteriales bacterium]